MTLKEIPRFPAVLVIVVALSACARVESPFKLVHLCVHNDNGMALLKSELEAAARVRQLAFRDDSDTSNRDLETVGYEKRRHENANQVVNYSGIRSDGMGFSATNLGLPRYQIALGFSEGSNRTEAQRIADEVVARLRQHWQVEDAPEGSGVMPSENCQSNRSQSH